MLYRRDVCAAAATFKTKRTIEVVNWSPKQSTSCFEALVGTNVNHKVVAVPAYFIVSPRQANELCTLCQIAEIEEDAEALVGTNVKHAAVAGFIDSPCQVSSQYH